jgi:hypothetical protein
MPRWRQAVFLRQRLDVIQRALSEVLDEESWSPATPPRLYIGGARTSARGWTMIGPEFADFFLDRGGLPEPRLVRLARALRCPGYEVDVRDPHTIALYEVDEHGRMRSSGARRPWFEPDGDEPVATAVSFGLVPAPDPLRDRIAALAEVQGAAADLAGHLGELAGFPMWMRDLPSLTEGKLVYEPPRIVAGARLAGTTARRTETRAASERTPLRVGPASLDRRGRRLRSASRPRR